MTEEQIYLSQENEHMQATVRQKKFEKYQMDNLGGFEKLFPIEIPDQLDDNKKTELV